MQITEKFTDIRDFLFTFRPHDAIKNQKVVQQIQRAWENGGSVDDFGGIWVDNRFLHTILRTTKLKARALYNKAPDDQKIIIGSVHYLRGSEILKLLDKERLNSATRGRYDFLGVSEDSYFDIERSASIGEKRDKSRESIAKERRRLKKERLKLGISNDELTGQPLDKSSSEFSHIRSFSHYPDLGTCVENGLIVNKSTHMAITEGNISNEKQLYIFCEEKGWSVSWYDRYLEFLRAHNEKPVL